MSTTVQTPDVYHLYLSIPPAEQPPSYYRLLGLTPFEKNAEVIETAACRVATYLHEISDGPDRVEIKKLLNEVAKARRTLLSEARRDAYDRTIVATSQTGNSPAAEEAPAEFCFHEWSEPSDSVELPQIKPQAEPVKPRRLGPAEFRGKSKTTRKQGALSPHIIGGIVCGFAAICCMAFVIPGTETATPESSPPNSSEDGAAMQTAQSSVTQQPQESSRQIVRTLPPLIANLPSVASLSENAPPVEHTVKEITLPDPTAVETTSVNRGQTEVASASGSQSHDSTPDNDTSSGALNSTPAVPGKALPKTPRGNRIPLPAGSTAGPKGGAYCEYWHQVPGDDLESFLDHIHENPKPNGVRTLTVLADRGTPSSIEPDHWGQRISGCLLPPATGTYGFHIEADDIAVLYLSATHRLENLKRVSPGTPIKFVAGRPIAFLLFFKENTGGEFFNIGWQLPNGVTEVPIPTNRLTQSGYEQEFVSLKPEECSTSGENTVFSLEDDGRIVVDAPLRSGGDFAVTFTAEALSVSRLRLELLNHKSLPGGGPGLGRSGMFSIEEIDFEVIDLDGSTSPVSIRVVNSTGSTRLAFDHNEKTAWQVSTARGRSIQVTLVPEKSLVLTRSTRLRIRLKNRTSPGCFRLLVTSKRG